MNNAKSTEKIKGLIVAPLTAYNSDGSVNLEIIPDLINFYMKNGVAGAFVNGTTGEGLSLTIEERMAIAKCWVESAPSEFKVIIHVTHTSAVAAQNLASHAAGIGAGGIGEMGPIFYKPPDVETLVKYCAQTASQAPELPYYYYHMPSMSGINFPMLDFLRTAGPIIPNLTGIKYTYENLMDFQQCQEFKDGKYDMLFGRDEILLCALALGCRGAVGSTYNFMAPLYNRIIDAYNSDDQAEAKRLQNRSMKIIQILKGTSNFFSAAKAIMKKIGLDFGEVRIPLENISEKEKAKLINDLTEADFFNICSKIN